MSRTNQENHAFFTHLHAVRQPCVPVVDAATARTAADLLREGWISARRMAREMGASFKDIDATFAHHGMACRLFD